MNKLFKNYAKAKAAYESAEELVDAYPKLVKVKAEIKREQEEADERQMTDGMIDRLVDAEMEAESAYNFSEIRQLLHRSEDAMIKGALTGLLVKVGKAGKVEREQQLKTILKKFNDKKPNAYVVFRDDLVDLSARYLAA